MSKRPKRSRHRIPDVALQPRSDPVSERYQAEIDASTAHLERAYRKAQKALEAAERRAERARQVAETNQRSRVARRDLDRLLLIVEDRRRELREIEVLMRPGDLGGRDGHRRRVRHEAGEITIPLGGTTGSHPKTARPPVFPVIRETKG